MVKLAGPRLSQKKITVQALDESARCRSSATCWCSWRPASSSASLTGLAFYALGLNHALVWGVLAGGSPTSFPIVRRGRDRRRLGIDRLHPVRQRSTQALLIGAASFAIHARRRQPADAVVDRPGQPDEPVRGLRRRARRSAGSGARCGLILGTPILMVVKTVCDRIDELKPVGELLGA